MLEGTKDEKESEATTPEQKVGTNKAKIQHEQHKTIIF